MMGPHALQFVHDVAIGTRVVVRYRLDAGATDALGVLVARSAEVCAIETRRGVVNIFFTDIVAAKQVPPAPQPRRRAE